jgi:hypothetical protein
MDIPTGLIGLVGILGTLCWIVVEWRQRRPLLRIALGLCCILLISFAASRSQSAPLFLHRQLLTAIDRELAEGTSEEVRRAIEVYNREYGPTHDFASAAASAREFLYTARATRDGHERKAQPKP